jgi:hypothetical protein
VPTFSVAALALSALAFFFAHEPVAIVLGARGQRLKDALEERARGRGIVLVTVGAALGVAAVASAEASLWPSLLLPILAAALLVPLVLSGKQKTLTGEILTVTAFSTMVLPLGAAAEVDGTRVSVAALVWWWSFFLGTLEVHAIKARHKERARRAWTRWASPALCGLTLLGCAAGLIGGGPHLRTAWLALIPPAAVILVLDAVRVHPRHLKRVGWTLVAANALTLTALLLEVGR